MLASTEEFFRCHEHTIAAVEAASTVFVGFATAAAVFVSLYLARRGESIRLRVLFGVALTNANPSVQYVSIMITNIGMREASLPVLFFDWRLPFQKKQRPETIANWVNVVSSNTPRREIKAGQDLVFPLGTMADFREKLAEDYIRIINSIKWFKAARIKRLRACVYTQDGREFPVVFAKVIGEELSSLAKKSCNCSPGYLAAEF